MYEALLLSVCLFFFYIISLIHIVLLGGRDYLFPYCTDEGVEVNNLPKVTQLLSIRAGI